jgi:hypothetical protein
MDTGKIYKGGCFLRNGSFTSTVSQTEWVMAIAQNPSRIKKAGEYPAFLLVA